MRSATSLQVSGLISQLEEIVMGLIDSGHWKRTYRRRVRGNADVAAAIYGDVRTLATSFGFSVESNGLLRGTYTLPQGAYGGHLGQRIAVKKGLDDATAALVVVHELVHGLRHRQFPRYVRRRREYEVEAEAVAYVVGAALGLDASGCAPFYIARWAQHSCGNPGRILLGARRRVREWSVGLIDGLSNQSRSQALSKISAPSSAYRDGTR